MYKIPQENHLLKNLVNSDLISSLDKSKIYIQKFLKQKLFFTHW